MSRTEPGSWQDRARRTIEQVDAALPKDASLEERKRALFEAYPFGERRYTPYKMWLKAQRSYLARFITTENESKRFPLSPLERAMLKSNDNRAKLEANEVPFQ